MAPRLSGNPEIFASLAPRGSVGRNATATGTKLRQQMRQLMSQGAINLVSAVICQTRVQRDQ
jgi:hypothetical protein